MCDTIVALGTATKDGATLFGKNSIREPDEVQNLVINPRKSHGSNEKVKCTFIEIPQVKETYRTLLSKPFWMYGAEMGINEYGVAIGNEAILSKVKSKEPALTGMDLIRLSLERSQTAKEARDTIIQLLETHGQGGSCEYRHTLYYQNGFIIADKDQAFVLETIEKNWAWKEIKDVWSISNKISIEKDYDATSSGLIREAVKNGWASSENDFNFFKSYSEPIFTWGSGAKIREQINRRYLTDKKSTLQTEDFMQMLRYHSDNPNWKPYKGLRMTSICSHSTSIYTKFTQVVGSLIAKIEKDNIFSYSTGSSNPCLSPFFPIFAPDTMLPQNYKIGGEKYDPKTFWWKNEKIHRKAVMNYIPSRDLIKDKMELYEKEMIKSVENSNSILNQKQIDEYFSDIENMIQEWGEKIEILPNMKGKLIYKRYWSKFNKLNEIK